MLVKCISDDRAMILNVLQRETGQRAVYNGLPEFAYTVGRYTLRRDGYIEKSDQIQSMNAFKSSNNEEARHVKDHRNEIKHIDNNDDYVLSILAEMGLCDYAGSDYKADTFDFTYLIEQYTGRSLMNIISLLSAHQKLINQSMGVHNAFHVAPEFMYDLLSHPPQMREEFLKKIYSRYGEYKGISFSKEKIVLTGFSRANPQEQFAYRQLSDLMMAEALKKQWIKPFTHNTRNKKYAFRIWLNSIGMKGSEYAEARKVLLERLPGRTDRKKI